MNEIFKEGINLYEKKQYIEAFDRFVECGEYFSAGMCQLKLEQLDNPINMFVLSIEDYQKKGTNEINTPNGISFTLLIYLKLTQLLFKTGDINLALGSLSYGLKENVHLLKDGESSVNLYKDVTDTLNCYLKTYKFTDDTGNGVNDIVFNEFSEFLHRKLKFLYKKRKSGFIDIEDSNNHEDVITHSSYKSCMNEICITESITKKRMEKNKKEIEFQREVEPIIKIIILEFKDSEYLRVVKYVYQNNNIQYFFNKNTNNLECEQILEDINIVGKNDGEVLNLKNEIKEKYKITKEILIKGEKSLNI